MNPIIGSIGGFELSWHGVFSALGILTPIIWLLKVSKDVKRDEIINLCLSAVIVGLIVSRLFHVIDRWEIYKYDFLAIFKFWEGGFALYGGILGGILGAVMYSYARRLPLGKIVNLSAPGVILGQAIGRIGCTINGDAYGTPTNLPWAFIYTHPNAAKTTPLFEPRHPAPVYEIFWDLIVFFILIKMRNRFRENWSLLLLYLLLYSTGRFIISFFRDEPDVLGPLHQAHLISIGVFIASLSLLYLIKRKWKPS